MKANKLSDIKALHTEITRNNEVGSDTYSNGYYGLYKQP